MEYEKNHTIPRAVMYDDEKNFNNPKLELNRQIIREDPSVYVVSRHEIPSATRDIVLLRPYAGIHVRLPTSIV